MESNCETSPVLQCPTTADESYKKQHIFRETAHWQVYQQLIVFQLLHNDGITDKLLHVLLLLWLLLQLLDIQGLVR